MLTLAISGITCRVENRLQNVILEAVVERRPYDLVGLADMKAGMEATDFFVEHMALAEELKNKADLPKLAASRVENQGLWLEFGVFRGRDIRLLPEYTEGKVYGFDSFEDLPEDWTFFQRKRFSLSGRLPEVPDNVELVKGWFEDTLPTFLDEHPEPIAFLHIDSDLYSSAKYLLGEVANRLVPATVILFDDSLN